MTRRPREQHPQALYHVIGRGCRGAPIFRETRDKKHFLHLLSEAARELEWEIPNWVLMTNHYHLALRLSQANLSDGMKHIHGLFAQKWNERHRSMGHVFFRRYANVPVKTERHVTRLALYLDLNPVRAGLCRVPGQWDWGGFNANAGVCTSLPFHDPDAGVRLLLSHVEDPPVARERYVELVNAEAAAVYRTSSESAERPPLREVLRQPTPTAIREAHELWRYSAREIASLTGGSPAAVYRSIARERRANPDDV